MKMIEKLLLYDRKNRVGYLDYLRLLATVLVITTHTLQAMILDWPAPSRAVDAVLVAVSFCLCCNVLFPMLSGALLLNGKQEPVMAFYLRRFLRVLLPAVAYYLCYCCLTRGVGVLAPANWTFLIREFAANTNAFTPHFWLIQVILMFYLSAPFLLVMAKHMDDAMRWALAVVILVIQGIFTCAPLVRVNFVAETILASWETVFLFGWLCTTEAVKKRYRLMMTLGALSAAFIAAAVLFVDGYGALIYNHTPVMMLFGAAVFLFFQRHGDDLFSRMPVVLVPFVRYSFSILLIHWYVLHLVVGERLGINGNSFGPAGVPVTVVLTLVLSLAFAVVFDHVVVWPLERLCKWLIVDKIEKNRCP